MTRVPSFTFAGGVLSRSLWGRYDLNKFQIGLKKAENCIISVEGGAEKRWGTYFTGYRKEQDSAQKAKLIPWRIADNDSYMLEFGDEYIRFMRFGGYVSIPLAHVSDPDSIAVNVDGFMEVPSPWAAEHVWELKFTFANDIMYITHKDYGPRELRRIGLYDWSLDEQLFDAHPDGPSPLNATYHNDTNEGDNYNDEPVPTSYRVSATLTDGTITRASPVETINADLGHRRTRVDLNWPDYTDAETYTIFKGANGIFGFIGYSDVSEFTDRNYAPSYDVVPIGKNVNFGADQNPSVVEFYKQRLTFAATDKFPQDIWFSRPYVFNSLRESIPLQDDDAFKLPLVGRQRHTINHMLMLKKFLIFTDSAEWTLNTVENAALSAATADPVIETYYGAHPWLRPLAIGTRVLFVQNKTGAVLDMGYEYTADAFKADDLTRLTRDLFKNKNIIAWDYAAHPHNILFCALDDGSLAIMTYVREHEIWGWTTSVTDGKFIDVACVTETSEEGVYFQVERMIDGVPTYFVERYSVNQNGRIEDMIYLDCAISYTNIHNVTDLAWISAEELEVTIPSPGHAIGDQWRLEYSEDEYYIVEVTDINVSVLTVVPINETISFPEAIDGTIPTAYLLASTITGLDHLDAETIDVLADGMVYRDLTIASGALTLPEAHARIHVGKRIAARIETLDVDVDVAKGQFREKTVHEIAVNLRKSRGVRVGVETADYTLSEIDSRQTTENMYSANAPLEGVYELPAHIQWGNQVEIVIESDDPLPMNVLNISPDIRYGPG